MYRDFERTSSEQAIKFVGGCLLTFFGVFLITSGRPRHDDEEETLSDAEGIEETIGLAEHGATGPQTPRQSRRGSGGGGSRRSSRVSFKDSINKPLAALAGTGFPTLRAPAGSPISKSPLITEPEEDLPPPVEIFREAQPSTRARELSSETVPTISSVAVSDGELPADTQPLTTVTTTETIERPATPPRAQHLSSSRPHSHHFSMISPSPFSSTVTAVVADKLLAHMDSPTTRRVGARRSRPGLRNSLFVPQDELEDEEGEGAGLSSAVERAAPLFEDDVVPDSDEGKKSVRGRARSLSHTLGELFGVRKPRRVTLTEGEARGESSEREGLLGGRQEDDER